MMADRDILLDLFDAALEAVAPGPALATAWQATPPTFGERVWILATGKAALPMATEAVAQLAAADLQPAGGLVVDVREDEAPHPAVRVVAGDHPEPGGRSLAAAEAVEAMVREVRPGDDVLVLLSGGTSSLIGAPVRGLSLEDLRAAHTLLLGSGLDITPMNRVRKRLTRWGAGRLARALAHARVHVSVVSDVIGDDVSAIGSGPCSPDPTRAKHTIATLVETGLYDAMPAGVRTLLERTDRGLLPETPKPGDAAFRTVEITIIANNRLALDAAAARAAALGLEPRMRTRALRGEAALCGERIADRLRIEPLDDARPDAPSAVCVLAGGETTVTLGEARSGTGGRCQELALAAAARLAGADRRITLLAAGTDGRDGPTDAAGAIVDETTWQRIAERGRDPAADLAAHDAGTALATVDALVRTGPTGTNVMDIVFAIVRPAASP